MNTTKINAQNTKKILHFKKLKKKFDNLNNLYVFERHLQRECFSLIAGVDEVGRGCLAGPLVTSAVILPEGIFLPNLKESKQLSPKKRAELFREIKKIAIAVSVVIVKPEEIDKFGVHKANLKALAQALLKLEPQPDYCLVDGFTPIGLNKPFLAIKKGDTRSASIAAASIIAKVTRDEIMVDYHDKYPNYGFAKHKGYGTKEHLRNLMNFGPCDIHRESFAPVKKALNEFKQEELFGISRQ